MTARASLLLLALSLLLPPLPARAAPPSFDCKAARLAVEKAICRSAGLSALDVEIAAAYGRAMQALSGPMREVLKQAQRGFIAARDDAFGLPDEDVEARLGDQVAFLKAIEVDGRREIAGSWRNAHGSIEVTARPNGDADVLIGTAEPTRARWLCDVEGVARRDGDAWVIAPAADDPEEWSVTLTPRDGLLWLAAKPAAGDEDSPPPFCGHNGTIDGAYLPVRPPRDFQ